MSILLEWYVIGGVLTQYIMAKNLNSRCKLCRRAGEKLFLKGDRCMTAKCAISRRSYAPGVHGQNPTRGGSEYGKQLAMKQKIKRLYGVFERQFRCHFEEAQKKQGVTGDLLLARLEQRFDNVVYRLGFAPSRALARQLVSHKYFLVNGKRMNVASYEVKRNDIVTLKVSKKEKTFIKEQMESMKGRTDVPAWLSLDLDKLEGKVTGLPTRTDVGVNVNPQLVVEYYSK